VGGVGAGPHNPPPPNPQSPIPNPQIFNEEKYFYITY